MSSAELTPDPVLAALLWHVPLLRDNGGAGGRAFIDAMNGTQSMREYKPDPADLLSLAAAAVIADDARDVEAQQRMWALMASEHGGPGEIFATCLAAASQLDVAVAVLNDAPGGLASVEDPVVRAHLALKMACYAEDRLLVEAHMALLELAEASTEPDSRLGILVRHERAVMTAAPLPPQAFGVLPDNELVEQPWLDVNALAAARDHEQKVLVARARDPWSWTFTAGATPSSRLFALTRQAAWAGSPWERRALRRQLGAQLLAGGETDGDRVAFALTTWLIGQPSINDEAVVARSVEPHLSTAHVDRLLNHLVNMPAPPGWRETTVATIALAYWDAMSDEMAEAIFDVVRPAAVEHPSADRQRRLLAALGLRSPAKLEALLAEAQDTELELFARVLGPGSLTPLSEVVLRRLRAAALDSVRATPALIEGWTALADLDGALAERGANVAPAPPLKDAPAFAVADLVNESVWQISDELLGSAVEGLSRDLSHAAKESTEGHIGIGLSVGQALGAAVRAALLRGRDDIGRTGVNALADVACDPRVAGQYRLEALAGLALASTDYPLPRGPVIRLRRTEMTVSAGFIMGISPEVLAATRLQALGRQLRSDEVVEVIVGARDPDPRVRQAVVSAAGRALSAGGARRLEDVLVTALFDPEENVLATSLGFLAEVGLRDRALRDTTVRRLEKLLESFSRRVRVQAATVARMWRQSAPDEMPDSVVDRAARDKSWLVREQFLESGSPSDDSHTGDW